jgi:pilus assembly protein CpaF
MLPMVLGVCGLPRERGARDRRVITRDEFLDLTIPLPDVVSMQTRQPNLEGTGEILLRRLVKEALRMRPDSIMG